ncbi:hypothetical protein [Alkalimonas amylolytica]|uniref:ASP external chaperone domain-containing protein n=1 Tax=Alkalimonas amylolytica TaxID=152573 RepID=A0A1H4CHZ7_ALKAM|nr:hypothetical protein [Alkalimonas amylolytica]SEA60056.1 hypothetical protein SAMN04488051_104172 [Alkalimonas amylolytica]
MTFAKQLCVTVCCIAFSATSLAETTFGAYRLVQPEQSPQLSWQQSRQSKAQFATASSATDTASLQGRVQANSMVVNRYSGQPGRVSGQLLLLLEDGADSASVLADFPLTILQQQRQLVLLQADSHTDLLALREQLLQQSGVKNVRLDVREQRYKTR